MNGVKRYSLLGVQVEALTMEELNGLIAAAVAADARWIIANHNLHSVYLFHHDEGLRRFYASAQHIHIDGMPLVLIGRLLGWPLERAHRTTYVDWVRPLLAEAQKNGWRVFYLGSRPEVVEQGRGVVNAEFPGLAFGARNGYFDAKTSSAENRQVLEQIKGFQPDVLLVGMGMPRQEHWICDNLADLPANAILNAGACLDYMAGATRTPPRWMGRAGLEWLYRLASEPGRLWRRYLAEPWYIAGLLLKDLWRMRLGPGRGRL